MVTTSPVFAKLRAVPVALSFITSGAMVVGAAACGNVGSDTIGTTPDASQHTTPDTGHTVAHPKLEAGAGDVAAQPDANTQAHEAGADGAHDAGHQADASAEAMAPRNYGDASTTFPAFTPDVPQVQTNGGPVLTSPQIVTVTWPDETNAAALESFGDDIGPSMYWADATHEYGVGPGWSGPVSHVRLTEQPIASWSDVQLDAWVADHLANNTMYGMPAPDGNTVYVFYLSPTTSLSYGGMDACQQGIGGYHISLAGSDYAYAVILQCDGNQLREATSSASHELVEAATDPHPNDIAAYYGFDPAHLAWDVFQSFQDEIADACEFYHGPSGAFYGQLFPVIEYAGDAGGGPPDAALVPDAGTVTYDVQRTWSNASAAAGHDPCVPVAAGPYFNVTPMGQETVTLNLSGIGGGSNAQGLGYDIKKGQTKTIAVGFHSDAPTSGPWTISVSEGNPLLGGSQTGSHVTTTIDHASGQNGDVGYITVTVNSIDTSMDGELLTIESQLNGTRSYVPILISNE
jgi:hypothetical protein